MDVTKKHSKARVNTKINIVHSSIVYVCYLLHFLKRRPTYTYVTCTLCRLNVCYAK